jgi:hypothetical protein
MQTAMRWIAIAAGVLAACSDDDTVTYYEDVLPVFQARCGSCHKDGGVAPFAIDDYAQARAYASLIDAETRARTMPPFAMDNSGDCQSFANSDWLSDDELATISAWVEGGALEGDPAAAPARPAPPVLGGETVTAQMAAPFAPLPQPDLHGDEYRCFRLDGAIPRDAFITGFEVIPGNRQLVHHVVLYSVHPDDPTFIPGQPPTQGELMAALDGSDGRPGWNCFFGAGGVRGEIPGLWTPGQDVVSYPAGLGMRVRAGTVIVAEVHYHAPSVAATDRTQIRVRLADQVESPARMLLADALVDTVFTGQPAQLASGQPAVDYRWTLDYERLIEDAPGVPSQDLPPRLDVYGAFPHMHELGRAQRANVVRGGEQICAGSMPTYDYNWQQLYFYDRPLAMFPGDKLDVTCTYDTRNRTEPVSAGFATTDEMCSFILFAVERAAP